MSISVFTGKPGNGKTLTMMHFLAEDIIRTERHVVTNIPIKLPELTEYIERTCEARKIRVPKLHRRLTIIDTTEALFFWRFRSGGFVLPKWDGKTPDGKVLDEEKLLIQSKDYFSEIGKHEGAAVPISYYISEAHRYYNAKRFAKISVIAELYVTHHRHLHDEVYFDTQFPKQLSVALRELTEEWHVLRNDYNRNIGFVKMIPRIRMSSFYDMPSGGEQKPFDKRSIHISENGVADCYESTGALGAIDRALDVEEKKVKKGIGLRSFIGLVVLCVVLGFIALGFAPKLILTKMFGGAAIEKQEERLENAKSVQGKSKAEVSSPAVRSASSDIDLDEALTLKTFSYYTLRGKMYFKGKLSDGRIINENSPGLESVNALNQQIRFKGKLIQHIPADYIPVEIVKSKPTQGVTSAASPFVGVVSEQL